MRGQVVIRRKGLAVVEVVTVPTIKGVGVKFYRPLVRKPFDRALGYAATLAARWWMELVDETGTVPPDKCAALVEELRARDKVGGDGVS